MFRYMDAESLLNMAEATPELKSFVFSSTIMKSVTFNPASDERTIEKFMQRAREELIQERNVPAVSCVQELHFTNCLTLPSSCILECADSCLNLRELHCVNCPVDPAELFEYLCLRLTCLEKLEWSLYDKVCRDVLAIVGYMHYFWKLQRPMVSKVYVEVQVTRGSVIVLNNFLTLCPELLHLHVQAVRPEHYGAPSGVSYPRNATPEIQALLLVSELIPKLETFTYSCELRPFPTFLLSQPERRGGPRLPFRPEDLIMGNIAALVKPARSFNVFTLADVVERRAILRGVEQAIVASEADPRISGLFSDATATPESWKDVARLTLALTARREAPFPLPPVAQRGYVEPLRRFFETCVSRMTELNLTAFHFAIDVDGCGLVASTLPKLRALAFAPCGVNRANSLESLARGCALLEHLDVRSSRAGDLIATCEACQLPLRFTEPSFGLLQRKTRLRRLSIDETARTSNLTFLVACRVQELRLSLDNLCDEELAQCPTELGQLLSANPLLSSLTLVARKVMLSTSLARTLAQVQSLRHLCVLTTASHGCSAAKDFFWVLEARLPRLLLAHAHYVCACNAVKRSSWIRQWRRPECDSARRDFSRWRWPNVTSTRTAQGVYLDDGPCIGRLCCVDTFIGLVRPRNRY
ncbi:hypothetical protein HPB52_003643 [Rhipicephalus sanguineus]|uniref:Uncharacterized protein n=1 Tax=Rhipicephalus sanguineus TaxID=34632 RepID=A0A9D4QBW8_RHISA|nr:hypothetical protein HPB52_003643 [Rhipicephalus sanguineus]